MTTLRINGEALRALRIAMGWSSGRFADAIGIGHPHLSNIEAGRRQRSEVIRRSGRASTRLAGAPGTQPYVNTSIGGTQ